MGTNNNFVTSNQIKNRNQILTFLSQNKKLFRGKYHIVRIGIFGSFARGEQYANSNIDFLIEFENNTQDLYDFKIKLKEFFRSHPVIEVGICQ